MIIHTPAQAAASMADVVYAPHPVEALKRYEDLGITLCIVGLKTDKTLANLPTLDRWAEFMRRMHEA